MEGCAVDIHDLRAKPTNDNAMAAKPMWLVVILLAGNLLYATGFVVAQPPVTPSISPQAQAATPQSLRDPLPKGAVMRLGSDRFRQEGEAQVVRYSRDGKTLASISRDSIIIWDPSTGRKLQQLRPRDLEVYARDFSALDFSPDGEEIAAADGGRVYVWEVSTGLQLMSFPMTPKSGFIDDIRMNYSPDGKQLAVGGNLSTLLFDTATGKQIKELEVENHRSVFYGICWSPDGTRLTGATMNPAVVVWNAKSGKVEKIFKAPKGEEFSYAPAISADGKTLLAGAGGVVNFWNFESGEHLKQIKLDADHINTLVLTPDNKTLIVGSQDGLIRIVDAQAGKLLRKIDGRLWMGRSIAVSPDFKTVALGAVYPTIRQWSINTGEENYPELTAAGHDAEVECVAYSPDGSLIASGGANRQIHLWDARTGKPRLKSPIRTEVSRIVFALSGQHFLTAWEYGGEIRVWDVADGKRARVIQSGAKRVRAIAMLPDGKQVLAVVWHGQDPVVDDTLQLWDFESGKKTREFKFKTTGTESVAITADGKTVIAGDGDGLIHVLEMRTGNELAMLAGHRGSVASVALSKDGRLLASGSSDRTIRIWDTKTWKRVRVLKGHNRAITSVAFSPNGRILASGSGTSRQPFSPGTTQRVRIWDVSSGEQTGAFFGHDTNTSALAFAPDGQRLATAHDNTTLLIWDVSQMAGR